jgi:hypothetical protein
MGILMKLLVVVTRASALLKSQGPQFHQVLFGDNATEVANNATLPMSPMVYPDYCIHVTWVLWCMLLCCCYCMLCVIPRSSVPPNLSTQQCNTTNVSHCLS